MNVFSKYLDSIENLAHRDRLEDIFIWMANRFPELKPKIAWNHPVFTHHETYIIGFSTSKNHIAVGPEKISLDHFSDEITKSGYTYTKMLFQIKWEQPIDFTLLEKIILFNIKDKEHCATFWRT